MALTGDAWVVKPAEENDAMLPQCHSRKDILKNERPEPKHGKSNLCPERADGRTFVSIRSHERVVMSKHQKSR